MMKYIVGVDQLTNHFMVCVFDESLIHEFMWQGMKKGHKGLKILGAGFFMMDMGHVKVFRDMKPESLGIGPSEKDQEILNLAVVSGYSGLDILNHFAYLEIQTRKLHDQKEN